MESSDEESFDEEPMVTELDNEADCRNNYKDHQQLLVHPKPTTAKTLAIPRSQVALKKNGKLVKIMLAHMRERKLKKPFDIEKCLAIHVRLKGMYSIAEEEGSDTIRRIWDIKRLNTFARSLWVRRRRTRVAAMG